LQATVQSTGESLALQIGNAILPLENAGSLAPGQRVVIEVLQNHAGALRLRITPQPDAVSPQPNAAPQPPAALTAAIVSALEQLAARDQTEIAPRLLPPGIPASPTAVRQLFSLFLGRENLGRALDAVMTLTRQAAAAGVMPQQTADEFAALLARYMASENEGLRAALRKLGENAAKPLEARLASILSKNAAPANPPPPPDDLRAVLLALRGNDKLAAFARTTTRGETLLRAIDSALDQLSGGHLQNLRASEMPYLFFEIPFAPENPIRRGYVHLFGEKRDGRNVFRAHNATVVLDLSTARLGDLWVTMGTAGLPGTPSTLLCCFKATTEELVRAINENADELSARLADAGYAASRVYATLWDGNRLRETADLLRASAGLNVRA